MGLTTADTAQSPQEPDMLSSAQKNRRSPGAFMGLSSAPGLCCEESPWRHHCWGPDSGAKAKCGKWGLGVASLDFQKRRGSRPSSQAVSHENSGKQPARTRATAQSACLRPGTRSCPTIPHQTRLGGPNFRSNHSSALVNLPLAPVPGETPSCHHTLHPGGHPWGDAIISHSTFRWAVPGETPSCHHSLLSAGQYVSPGAQVLSYLPEEDAAVPAEVQGVSILLLGGVVLLKRKIHQLPLHMAFF